jgi:hypothetical protein
MFAKRASLESIIMSVAILKWKSKVIENRQSESGCVYTHFIYPEAPLEQPRPTVYNWAIEVFTATPTTRNIVNVISLSNRYHSPTWNAGTLTCINLVRIWFVHTASAIWNLESVQFQQIKNSRSANRVGYAKHGFLCCLGQVVKEREEN